MLNLTSIRLARMLKMLALMAAVTFQCRGQVVAYVAAPAVISPCLVQYSLNQTLGPNTTRLFLYNADNTYVEINSYSTAGLGTSGGTSAVRQGSYTYTVDPLNASHATIVYDGGSTSPPDQLYFLSSTTGTQSPSLVVANVLTGFTLYPRQNASGGVNVSNRIQLNANGSTYTGLVIQGGARWVLIRAVGSTLAKFGVSPVVSGPSFTLYNSQQTSVGTSSVWSADPNLVTGYNTIFSLAGAFPLNSGSDEGVALISLNPGAYTIAFQATSGGQMLCEAYLLPF
jgi:hypothetical protein